MRNLLLISFLISQIGILNAQKKQSELIIGTWRFEKKIDLRTDAEKSEFVDIIIEAIETENESGYPDLTFKKDNLFERYYTKENIGFGRWEIKGSKLFIYRLIGNEQSIKSSSKLVEKSLNRKLIFKGNDGNYYFKADILKIKNISKNEVEFGDNKEYNIYKKSEIKDK